MSEIDNNAGDSELDRATAARLAKLRTMPIDTANLERAILKEIPRRATRHPMNWVLHRPLRAVAASIFILALIGAILLSTSSGPVLASAAQMAQVHEDLVAGRLPAERVASIDEANKALAMQWPEAPELPGMPHGAGQSPPSSHVMACCMRTVKSKKMACVLIHHDGVPVTMSIANAADMQLPRAPIVSRDGVAYRVQNVDKLNMVMTEREGRWLCLIGELPAEQLIDLAAKLRFQVASTSPPGHH